jgi:predicted dehydrogenase
MISMGVIGYGYWGPNLARNASEAAGSRLTSIADMSAAALFRAKKRHPHAKLYADPRDLICDPAVDVVLIATPVSSHFELALAVLKAGKHVLIEKPIASTSEEARILIREARRRNLVLMVDHTFIYTSAVRKIHELISNGSLGDIYYYDSTRVNLGLFQRDVNVIWDLAVHDMAILCYLFAEQPIAITASGTSHIQGSPENIAHVTLFYDNGSVAQLNVNWLAPVKVRQVLIGGSQRMIVYDDLEPSEKVKVYDHGVYVNTTAEVHQRLVSYRTGDMWAPQVLGKEALLTEIEHFIDCISNGVTPTSSGESGLNVLEMLEAAALSLRQRGAPILLGQKKRAS